MWQAIRRELPGPERFSGARGLTICSVAYKAKGYLEHNYRQVCALNPQLDERPTWFVFDNNDQASDRIEPGDPRFRVIRPERREGHMGYEHALGLVTLLPHIRSRFVLFLDPDCYIVLAHWIDAVTTHMDEHELGFFGTPINPRRHNSYRYFPYCVCMFVDLARVPVRDLCLLPAVWAWKTNVTYRVRKALAGIPKAGILFRWLLTEQWLTNGWRIKEQYGDGRLVRQECVQPVWDIDAAVRPGSLARLINHLTPASVAPIPKKPGYCSALGFAALGAPDLETLGWEEFVWRDRPFAFHVGSAHQHPIDQYSTVLPRLLDAFSASMSVGHQTAAAGGADVLCARP